jgi:hypothetical protein
MRHAHSWIGWAAVAAAAAVYGGAATARADTGNAAQAGAYCPLPRAGEKPSCLEPARAEYTDFFQAIDESAADDARLARVEEAVARGDQDYLALSSLAWGYYRLSQQAAATPGADPEIAARLERWNEVLGAAYGTRPENDPYREAVRTAAIDLQEKAPPVTLRCTDANGDTTECDSTEAVVRGIDAAAADVGPRGALERLLERWFGASES